MKAAIITHYYKSKNYGGTLQAYAMCKAIEKLGYTAEQLCFTSEKEMSSEIPKQEKKLKIKKLKIAVKVLVYNILCFVRHPKVYNMLRQRSKAVFMFNQNVIPHSRECYKESDIINSVKSYDLFITGSDMVWSPDMFSDTFFLNFVPVDIPKFSYAPSIGVTSLTDKEQKIFRSFLKSYQAVSVREHNAISLLKKISPVSVEWVLDPTLILEREEWDEICSKRIIKEPYLFCYFLGNNIESRKSAEEYAKAQNLKLVTIPYLLGGYRRCDCNFGDIQLSKISPPDFISLIRYSEAVFTDSFHACVFSFLYQRDMFAFRRNAEDRWGSRIYSFLELIGCVSRYCDTHEKESMDYIETLPKIDYKTPFVDFEIIKKKSLDYLEKNLRKAEETIENNEQ